MKKIELKKIKLKGIGRLKYYIMEGDEQVSAFMELMSIYIKPEFRRQGYGSALITKLVEAAKQKNIGCIYVKVTKENETFRKFLEKNGFTPSPKKMLFQKRTRTLTYQKVRKYLRRLCTRVRK